MPEKIGKMHHRVAVFGALMRRHSINSYIISYYVLEVFVFDNTDVYSSILSKKE